MRRSCMMLVKVKVKVKVFIITIRKMGARVIKIVSCASIESKKTVMTDKEYNRLVDDCADDLYRYAHCCCRNAERCSDAVQDAYASLWERRRLVDSDKGRQWLFSAVHNRLMSLYRRDKTMQKVFEALPNPLRLVGPDETFDLKDAMDRALATLPAVQRECLHLYDIEGYHYKEIATILNITDQQVAVNIFRARVALKRLLKEFHETL